MKLSQYKEKKNHKKIIAIALVILGLIGGVILEKTFANFKAQKSFKVMEGNFIYEGSGDIIFAFHSGNEFLTQMPQKFTKYEFDRGECDKGATIEWNNEKWAPTVLNLKESKTKCDLYFTELPSVLAKNFLENKQKTNPNDLAYDNTKDNNIRYIGTNPNNYVSFNNTTWRVIGVMNNVEDSEGNVGSHLKIISDSIGGYSWDSSPNDVNNGNGVNEWSEADIQKVLNENYYNKKAGGICYNGYGNSIKSCPDWESIGLDEDARNMVSKIKWHTGACKDGKVSNIYTCERGTAVSCTNCSDKVVRTTEWTGYVGLMYPSDFGFAISNNLKDKCLNNLTLDNLDDADDCLKGGWLAMQSPQYTITPGFGSSGNSNNYVGWGEGAFGGFGPQTLTDSYYVRPVVYLNSSVKIVDSSLANYGSKDNPLLLSAN